MLLAALTLLFGLLTHSAGQTAPDTAIMLALVSEEPTVVYDFADGVACDLFNLPNTCSFGDSVREALQ